MNKLESLVLHQTKPIGILGLILCLNVTSVSFAQAPLFYPPQTSAMPPPQMQGRLIAPQPVYPAFNGWVIPQPYQYPPHAYPQTYPVQPARSTIASPPKSIKNFQEFSGYLGLITDIVPSSVIAQLPDGITQGVLFKGFSSNSPASNSDLKPFDVIFSYDETKVSHPEQLINAIRNDKPGNKVKLKIVRKGKILEIPVTIGSQKTPNPKDVNGLEIKQFGEDNYRAIIHFLGPNGNKQLRSFQGTRDEIFDEVLNTHGLPQLERQQLLYAMQPRNNSKRGFGSFFPFGNNGSKDWKFMDPGKYFKW